MAESTPSTPSGIAVIGIAGRFPEAADPRELWRNLRAGRESIRFFTDDELRAAGIGEDRLADPSYIKAKAVLEDIESFDARLFGFSPREAQLLDPQMRLFLECCWEALEDGGYSPADFEGLIGVFGGASLGYYLIHNLHTNPDLVDSTDPLLLRVLNDKDCLTTLASYKLNLRGPSVAVQTACSTSLVAVHMACDSLLSFQCDLALAGGVTVRVPHRNGYRHRPGSILSPDGHCRPFSADAAGTVGGNGAGLVLLKRLEEALEDGDPIYGVVRGSAINNDGSLKVGFTAPSVEGQTEVIATALAQAEVDPDTVDYVEAHGTGTDLGDPIEVKALTEVYRARTGRKGYCALGSIKSNIGHLDAAAGVAGMIKTLLALQAGEIPPSLHCEQPNPKIGFPETPFYVNTELRPWPRPADRPRRAAISSFGVGGTNAHVVLEEAPPRSPGPPPARPRQLLTLSAHSGEAVAALAERLEDHLENLLEQGGLDPAALADLAYTLQVGRQRLESRRAVVGSDARELAAALRQGAPVRKARAEGAPPVLFLFPGQGAQYAGMAKGLHGEEPVFREAFDRVAELFRPHLGEDLREWVLRDRGDEAADRFLEQTAPAQAALFTVEYALAKLWSHWGIRPAAMLGHSLGEWVAATLAGVFTLEHAVALVAARGRRMAAMEPGAMVAVHLGEVELRERLEGFEGLSLAAVNGPALCTVSGPTDRVAAFVDALAAEGVEHRPLHTSHAFHSALMDGAAAAFVDDVAAVERRAPQIPFYSNVTGRPITAEEATDPAYWGRQIRSTVRFHDALAEALAAEATVVLEVGPGRSLSTLVQQQAAWNGGRPLAHSLPHPKQEEADGEVCLAALGTLWTAGVEADWEALHGPGRRRVSGLPTFPFQRHRYWIEAGSRARGGGAVLDGAAVEVETADTAASERPDWMGPYVAPQGEAEERVVAIWQQVLGIGGRQGVGSRDDFFELGGHSLLATQVVARVQQDFGLTLPLETLYEASTPQRLAALLEERRAAGEGSDAASAAEDLLPQVAPDLETRFEPFPLTDIQQAYWVGRSGAFELGKVATHWYIETEDPGLDVERFQQAWQRLIERHEMLRAVFLPDGRQRILDEMPRYDIAILDLRGKAPEEVERELLAVRERMSHQILDAQRWPLFELRLSLLDDGRVRLHFSLDLLLADAWSFVLLTRELATLYKDPQTALEPLELSFRDYVLAEHGLRDTPLYAGAVGYWRERLKTLPPAPQLPLLGGLDAAAEHRFHRRRGGLEPASWRRLRERAARAGLTPSGLTLAVFAEVVAVWSRSPRFTLNLTLFNRLPLHPQVNRVIGDFTSLTLLEVNAATDLPFLGRARRLQKQLWADLDHRYVSGVWVMREMARLYGGASRRALMPVVFTSTLGMSADASRGEGAERRTRASLPGETVYSISQTPQVWLDFQIAERAGALRFNWDTVDALFPEGVLDALFGAYCDLLQRLADDEDLWRQQTRAALLPAVAEAGSFQRAHQGGQPQEQDEATAPGPPQALLHAPFLERAAEHPDRPAVVSAERDLSYGELRLLADRLARRLRAEGATPDRLVAVVTHKSWQQVAAVFGVLQSGAAYLPIDPTVPPDRLRTLLEVGEVELVLTQVVLKDNLEWPEGVRLLTVETEVQAAADDAPLTPVQRPDQLAYVIFTSGSTGTPKGVMIEHRAALNTVLDINERFTVSPGDRTLALSNLNFDLSVYDLFGPLAVGGAVVLPEPEAHRDPARWVPWVRQHKVTIWNSVPALMQMLVDHVENRDERLPEVLRLVLMSGDWIPVSLPDQIRARLNDVQVISLGGATEASIWSIAYPIGAVDSRWSSIPYGRALRHQSFQVLDPDLEPCPPWVPGDLYIGGVGLARGYWGSEERTRKAFLTHPVSGERLYRTGDLGRMLPDGTIEFLGREDNQVKVQGHRIELAEIEAVLLGHPAVAAAVAAAVGEAHGSKKLVAYVVAEEGAAVEEGALRSLTQSRLPAYMVPAVFLFLPALPLSPNGKVDRGNLPKPEQVAKASAVEFVEPSTPVEEVLAECWREVLAIERVSIHDDFFQLGGDSLLATRVYIRLQEIYPVEVPLASLFERTTIAQLAEEIDALLLAKVAEMSEDETEMHP